MITYTVTEGSSCHMNPKNPHPIGHGKECCCVCENHLEVFSHPRVDRKSADHSTGIHVCIIEHNTDQNHKAIISEKHGGCELFTLRKFKMKRIKLK
jgi:hypothetical protein